MMSSTVLEFEIRSLDPTRSVSKVVPDITRLSSEMESALGEKVQGVKVRIRRAEGVPGFPELQHILVHIDWDVLRKAAEGAVASFATTQFLTLIRNQIKNLGVRQVTHVRTSKSRNRAVVSEKHVAGKNDSKAKRRVRAKGPKGHRPTKRPD